MSKNLSSIVTVLGVGTLGLLTLRRGSQYGQGFLDVMGVKALDRVPAFRRRTVDTLYIDGLFLTDRHINNPKANRSETLGDNLITFPNLEEIVIRNAIIKDLPTEIGMLTKLKKIVCKKCRIASIPESIGNLTNLEHLDLSDNNITSLPDSIGNLTELKLLDISKNKVSYIPESIGNLENLQHLDLGNNNLTNLPKRLADLQNIEGLFWIYGNNILKPSTTTLQYWAENMPEIMFRDIMMTIRNSSISELRRF